MPEPTRTLDYQTPTAPARRSALTLIKDCIVGVAQIIAGAVLFAFLFFLPANSPSDPCDSVDLADRPLGLVPRGFQRIVKGRAGRKQPAWKDCGGARGH